MKKAQTAMEFLMTYGWALLIVLIAIGILAAFGVFRSGSNAEACLFGPGLSCKNFKIQNVGPQIDESIIEARVTNGFGKDITEFFVTVDPKGRICHGITGNVASAKLTAALYPARTVFPLDSSLTLRRSGAAVSIDGIKCNNDIINCCRGNNAVLTLPNLPYTFQVPCSDSNGNLLGFDCNIAPPGTTGQGRLPSPGSRTKLDVFITYKFADSTLVHSRPGQIMGKVEAA